MHRQHPSELFLVFPNNSNIKMAESMRLHVGKDVVVIPQRPVRARYLSPPQFRSGARDKPKPRKDAGRDIPCPHPDRSHTLHATVFWRESASKREIISVSLTGAYSNNKLYRRSHAGSRANMSKKPADSHHISMARCLRSRSGGNSRDLRKGVQKFRVNMLSGGQPVYYYLVSAE